MIYKINLLKKYHGEGDLKPSKISL